MFLFLSQIAAWGLNADVPLRHGLLDNNPFSGADAICLVLENEDFIPRAFIFGFAVGVSACLAACLVGFLKWRELKLEDVIYHDRTRNPG